jgi:hypothetical protein
VWGEQSALSVAWASLLSHLTVGCGAQLLSVTLRLIAQAWFSCER